MKGDREDLRERLDEVLAAVVAHSDMFTFRISLDYNEACAALSVLKMVEYAKNKKEVKVI